MFWEFVGENVWRRFNKDELEVCKEPNIVKVMKSLASVLAEPTFSMMEDRTAKHFLKGCSHGI